MKRPEKWVRNYLHPSQRSCDMTNRIQTDPLSLRVRELLDLK